MSNGRISDYLTRNTTLREAKLEVWKTQKQVLQSANLIEKYLRAALDLVSHIQAFIISHHRGSFH